MSKKIIISFIIVFSFLMTVPGFTARAEMVKKVINGRTVYVDESSKLSNNQLAPRDELKDSQTEDFKRALEKRREEEAARRAEEERLRQEEEERRRAEEEANQPDPEVRPFQGRNGYECPDDYYCRATHGGVTLTCIYEPLFSGTDTRDCGHVANLCRRHARYNDLGRGAARRLCDAD